MLCIFIINKKKDGKMPGIRTAQFYYSIQWIFHSDSCCTFSWCEWGKWDFMAGLTGLKLKRIKRERGREKKNKRTKERKVTAIGNIIFSFLIDHKLCEKCLAKRQFFKSAYHFSCAWCEQHNIVSLSGDIKSTFIVNNEQNLNHKPRL